MAISVCARDVFSPGLGERESGEMCVNSKIGCCVIVAGVGVDEWVGALFLSTVKSSHIACIHFRGCH